MPSGCLLFALSLFLSLFAPRPFPNLLQLLSVLPPQSADFLPGPYKALMVEANSPILEYYPTEFEVREGARSHGMHAFP